MEEKGIVKISLSTFFLILAIIVIIVLVGYIYISKTNSDKEIANLEENNANMQEKVDNLQEKIDSISNTINSDKDVESNIKIKNGKFENTGRDVDPDEGSGISDIILNENNKFELDLAYGGKYTIENNILMCNVDKNIIYEGGESVKDTNVIFEFKILKENEIEFSRVKNSADTFELNKGFTYKNNENAESNRYSELTSSLNDKDVLYVTKAEKNSNNTYTLYGVVFKCNGEVNPEYQIPYTWSATNEYKKITISSDIVCVTGYPEEENSTVGRYFNNYKEVSVENTTNPLDSATYTFEFKNGECVKVIDYCTSM